MTSTKQRPREVETWEEHARDTVDAFLESDLVPAAIAPDVEALLERDRVIDALELINETRRSPDGPGRERN